MKRILTAVLIVTSISIFYVFQHAKLLEYSYNIHSAKKSLSLLIDQNRTLRYNISKLEAPARLEEAVSEAKVKQQYISVDCYKLKMQGGPAVNEVAPVGPFMSAGKLILSMFSLDSEAVANELSE